MMMGQYRMMCSISGECGGVGGSVCWQSFQAHYRLYVLTSYDIGNMGKFIVQSKKKGFKVSIRKNILYAYGFVKYFTNSYKK